ncbi:MAG: GNAT family N-acetyltransferase [Chloroflexi bacterium]|nr:GNAT family N-acetyltransferase [Chloroflexota bacterium]
MPTTPPILTTARLVLRMATNDDIPGIIHYYTANHEHLAPFSQRRPADFLTEHYWQQVIAKSYDDFATDRSLRLVLFDSSKPQQMIGEVNFNNFVRGAAQFCHLGYGIDAGYQGGGYMTEALQAAIRYVFDELHMHRVMANYLPHNQRSGKVLRRLGFVVEGYARDYLLIDGAWQDHILTSLINPSWTPA